MSPPFAQTNTKCPTKIPKTPRANKAAPGVPSVEAPPVAAKGSDDLAVPDADVDGVTVARTMVLDEVVATTTTKQDRRNGPYKLPSRYRYQ